ncbi:MAG: hypothetical protein FJ297_18255 [Planctomycetes bacterium]|nr:hypothetical protein [Planctomycetota bacterium]
MEAYYQKRTIWTQRAEGDAAPEPTAPNLEELAAKSGMTAGRTGLVDYHTVESTELGKTSRFDQNTFSFRPFREIGFDPDIPMYRPRDIRDAKETDVEYVYWKTSVKDQFIPELGDIRDDVARDWKKLEARKLVDKRVEELRKEASEREGGLKERLPAQAEKITSTNEFSWITMGGGLIPQMNSPQLSSVEGVDAVTWEFMETVFAKKAGELGVVRNASHDSAYVFLVTRRGPDVDAQRQRFLRTFFQGGSEVAALAQGEFQDYYRRWYAQLEREMKVEWKRPPQ